VLCKNFKNRSWLPRLIRMRYSKHNIFSRIRDSKDYFIVNPLSGNADILTREDAEKVEVLRQGGELHDPVMVDELASKGYLADEASEEKLFRSKYLDFLDSRDKDEIQIFFVTNYSCNFACTYCYQDQYNNPGAELSREIIDAFFTYVGKEFAGRRKYITVFGGEPLLGSPRQKELISYLIEKSVSDNLELSFVTNGYSLEDYVDILFAGKVREIQVTLDGTASTHNGRRFLKGGEGTFDRIVRGIDACLAKGMDINLRMVVDRENIGNLPELAQFAINKGWTKSRFFKTQIGRNYELHHCQSSPDKLFDRVSLYAGLYELVKQHPHIVEFYKPSYSISKFISENGELPDPLFDSCPACKTEWAFDYTGKIYSCTATVGKSDEELGAFYPEVTPKSAMVAEWESRDVTAIDECRDCNLQLACGGGCGSVAKNRTGRICSSDCRPVTQLLEIGFSAYLVP
jgi:uncharacterized protein